MIYFYCSEVHQGCFHRLGLCSSGRGRLLLVPAGPGKGEITSLFLHTLHPPRSSKAFHFRDSLAHRSLLQMTLTPAVPMKVGLLDCKENKSEVAPFIGRFPPGFSVEFVTTRRSCGSHALHNPSMPDVPPRFAGSDPLGSPCRPWHAKQLSRDAMSRRSWTFFLIYFSREFVGCQLTASIYDLSLTFRHAAESIFHHLNILFSNLFVLWDRFWTKMNFRNHF